ncbi:MAG: phosphoribosylanthranilate isomerase, partial [Desulfobacterales bacterium]
QMTPQKVRKIVRTIPPFVKTVGVFVNEETTAIREVMQHCGLDLVQLHGDESPDLCAELMPYAIKALRVKDESCLRTSRAYHGKVRALLLDTYAKQKVGGTGKTFDWNLAIKIKETGIPIILAGGLGPANINLAIQTVNPYAVDLNSGIEEYPGKKDPALMKAVMAAQGCLNPK